MLRTCNIPTSSAGQLIILAEGWKESVIPSGNAQPTVKTTVLQKRVYIWFSSVAWLIQSQEADIDILVDLVPNYHGGEM